MNERLLSAAVFAAACAASLPVAAQSTAPPNTNNQVVVPEVDRRDIKVPRFPSNDFEVGLFGGTYSTQNFGANAVGGIKLGYHITEDFFVEAVYALSKVDDELYRQILPGGIFPEQKPKLTYYNVSFGYNVLPGEVFVGRRWARPSAFYLIAGVGSTKVDTQRRPTLNFGFGYRVFLADWAALQVDLRDHVYSLDLLGKRTSTQNLELTGGLSLFF